MSLFRKEILIFNGVNISYTLNCCTYIAITGDGKGEKNLDAYYKDLIAKEFLDCISNTITRIQARENKKQANNNPFQKILLPNEAVFWSRFERSFSTSFGQRLVETISKYVVLANEAEAVENQKQINFFLSEKELTNIRNHIQDLRSKKLGRKPNWREDLRSVHSEGQKKTVPIKANFDLWYKRANKDTYISIKTVKPNIDQTAVAKEDMMKVKCGYPECEVYFGLYYNPFGNERKLYAHNPPFSIFDMHKDPVILIGKAYWDTIGKVGTYEEVLQIAESIREEARKIMEQYKP